MSNLNNMETIVINSKTLFKNGHIKGNTIERDFYKNGYITITYSIKEKKLQVCDVNGFEIVSCNSYIKNPKTSIEERNNKNFLERWYKGLEMTNQQKIVNLFFS